MDYNSFFDKFAQYDDILEPEDPRRKFMSAQGAIMGGVGGYLLKDKLKQAIAEDALISSAKTLMGKKNWRMRTLYRSPGMLSKLLKASPALSTAGGALAGSLALKKLYDVTG